MKRRILLGTYVLSAGYYDAYYKKAQQVRTLLRRDFEAAFESCDAIVLPTTPETAFRLGEKRGRPARAVPVATSSRCRRTWPACRVSRSRAGSTPASRSGFQILGRPREDATVLRIADAYQRRTDHHLARPPA